MKIDMQQGTEDWKKWRREGIGASDIAAIMGISKYKTAKDIFNEKMGLEVEDNHHMRRGRIYEDEARIMFNLSQRTPFEPAIFVSDSEPLFRASLDGWDGDTVLEIKVPTNNNFEAQRESKFPPEEYFYQMQWQMMVSGAKMAIYCAYNADTQQLLTTIIWPDLFIFEKMKEAAYNFWEHVKRGEYIPDLKEEIRLKDEGDIHILDQLEELKFRIKNLQDEYDKKLDLLTSKYQDTAKIVNDGFCLKRIERESIDYKQAAKDAGINLTNYKKPKIFYWKLESL